MLAAAATCSSDSHRCARHFLQIQIVISKNIQVRKRKTLKVKVSRVSKGGMESKENTQLRYRSLDVVTERAFRHDRDASPKNERGTRQLSSNNSPCHTFHFPPLEQLSKTHTFYTKRIPNAMISLYLLRWVISPDLSNVDQKLLACRPPAQTRSCF